MRSLWLRCGFPARRCWGGIWGDVMAAMGAMGAATQWAPSVLASNDSALTR